MILLLVLFAAQIKAAVPSGEMIFAQQCSVPYCHGAGGTASRAPALAGTNLTREQLRETISQGRPRFGMPAFGSKLDKTQIEAVVAYITSLSAPAGTRAEPRQAPITTKLSQEEIIGRDLFFDSERLPSCGACHAVNGVGGNIAPPITTAKFTKQSLDNVTAPGVVTAEVKGEAPFVAIFQTAPAGSVRLADISGRLPVVRTFSEQDVKISSAEDWKHSTVADRYSAAEIQAIVVWLRAVLPAR
jgi:mono/diheme cytochrome c family protein